MGMLFERPDTQQNSPSSSTSDRMIRNRMFLILTLLLIPKLWIRLRPIGGRYYQILERCMIWNLYPMMMGTCL